MPTERFYNLPEVKKKLIHKVVVEEFTRVPFEKVSINKIIKAAEISRGSFYTYFEDKYDVLGYLFEGAAEQLQNAWADFAGKNDGDLWKTAEELLNYCIKNTKENVLQLAKNVMESGEMFQAASPLCQNKHRKETELLRTMYRSINISGFKNQSEETFENLVSMIFHALVHCMGFYYNDLGDEEKAKKVFREKLENLRYGICKQELQL